MKLKDIRFNLRFSRGKNKDGDEQFDIIRSLQDLKDNLNIDDLYLYFTSGQLARWLSCIGEVSKAEAVSKIGKTTVKEELERLFVALDLKMADDEMAVLVESYNFSRLLQERKYLMTALDDKVEKIVEQDYIQYNQCLEDIISVEDDFAAVKSRVRAMLKNYPEQFKLDWMRFYDVMMERCRPAIFVVLMDPGYRKYYLGTREEINTRYYGELEIPDIENENVQRQTPVSQFMSRIEDILQVTYGRATVNGRYQYKLGITLDGRWALNVDSWKERNIIKEVDYSKSGGEWEDAVDKDTKIMILHCGENITIRPAGDKGHESKGNQCERFALFNGLDFRTSVVTPRSPADILLYMEVK